MTHLLPSLTLGFRTLIILAIITADAFAAYMLTTRVIAPKLIETKIVDLRSEIGQLPPDGGVLPTEKPPRPAVGMESVGSMFQIKDIVVNPAGTNGTRYLCTTVALEITNPAVEDEATAREAQVRDLLIEILGRRTVTELSSLEMRDYIREEIETSVNALLTSGEIDGVYFSNFVLQ
jgi:flagellar basal body-associated protein FliL